MAKVTYSVVPVDDGWLVKGEEASFAFRAGSMAEAKARELAQAAWADGVPAEVSIKGRDGRLLGRWNYGAEAGLSFQA
jgi:hypothetical protein